MQEQQVRQVTKSAPTRRNTRTVRRLRPPPSHRLVRPATARYAPAELPVSVEQRWIRAELAAMRSHPCDRGAHVGDLVLQLNLWLQPVVGADADVPATTDQVADQW